MKEIWEELVREVNRMIYSYNTLIDTLNEYEPEEEDEDE